LLSEVKLGTLSPSAALQLLPTHTPELITGLVQLSASAIDEKARLDSKAREGERTAAALALQQKEEAAEDPLEPVAGPERVKNFERLARQRQRGFTVVLEDVANPTNAAAVLRSCDAFGVTEVIFVFVHNEAFDMRDHALHAASSSSYFWVKTRVMSSVDDALGYLREKGPCVSLATSLHSASTDVYETELALDNIAIWLGNEHRGLSTEALEGCDAHIHIPMVGMVESLNLSVSGGMVIAEVSRQRKKAAMTSKAAGTGREFGLGEEEQAAVVAAFQQDHIDRAMAKRAAGA